MDILDSSLKILFEIVTKDTGVLIGLALLWYAASYLPEDVRKHVRTAGFSIAVYQIFRNYYFRKQWAEAEQERERLKKEKKELERRGGKLMQELEELIDRAEKQDNEIAALRKKRQGLETRDDFDPNEFDRDIEVLKQKNKSLRERIKALPPIIQKVGETTRQLDASIQ